MRLVGKLLININNIIIEIQPIKQQLTALFIEKTIVNEVP